MESVIDKINARAKKSAVVNVRSGDTVRVHQKVSEGGKERIQVFEGLVIRTGRRGSLTSTFTVRRIASGVGVEKTFLIHSPGILKIEVTKRSKVRRNYLGYMRGLTGKSARLTGIDFDRESVNAVHDKAAEAEEAKIKEEVAEAAEAAASEKEEEVGEAPAAKTEAQKLEEQPKERASAEGPAQEQNKE